MAKVLMNFTDDFNITNLFNEYRPDSACINYCQEWITYAESKVKIDDLTLIVIALFSLLINNLINNYSEFIIKKFDITQRQLELIYIGTNYFSFFLLAIFLIYQLVFK